jgi:hypothetical protein
MTRGGRQKGAGFVLEMKHRINVALVRTETFHEPMHGRSSDETARHDGRRGRRGRTTTEEPEPGKDL